MCSLWLQFGDEPAAEAVLWVDTLSFNSAIPELETTLDYLEDLSRETNIKHPKVAARVATTNGILETYKTSLEGCMARQECSYMLFLEDDRCAVCHPLLVGTARGVISVAKSWLLGLYFCPLLQTT